MAVERDRDGVVIFVCDECGDELITDLTRFGEAIEVLNSSDWLNLSDNGEFKHYCEVCSEPVEIVG